MAVKEKAALRGAAAEGSGGGYISIRNSGSISSGSFFVFSPAAFLRALFFGTREISDFALFSAPPPPYTLGFSAGELPAWPQRRCICLQHSRFGSALFLRPFAGVTAEWEQGMPLPHVPLPHPDPPPLVGDHLLISSFALASPPASFFAVLQLLEPSLLCDSPHRPLSRERRCGQR